MSVTFFKTSLALLLMSFSSTAVIRANDGFYPSSYGQPTGMPMPGPSMSMPGPMMQQADPRYAPPFGQPGSYGSPLPQAGIQMQGPHSAPMMPQPTLEKVQIAGSDCAVDLVIEDISFYTPGTKLEGPSYTVRICNRGSAYASRFHIGLFASLDGVVNQHTPKAFMEVRELAPGSQGDYTIRLPVNADANFDPRFGQFRPFTHLAAVVDVFRIVPEADESNNTAMLAREAVDNAQ